jgi:hypothetical protein
MNMMLDWNEYRRQLAAGITEIGRLSPDIVRGYMGMSAAGGEICSGRKCAS